MNQTILSIQSHVAHGVVGGRAATFPLQLLGWEVDVVNTVNFSNHSGYRQRPGEGTRTTGEQLEAIFNGLEMNQLLEPNRLLTGYTPNADCLSAIIRLAHKLRSRSPELVFLLDPVLGDNNRLYVSPDVIPLYRQLLPAATIITPNWFEVETLVDFKLDSLRALQEALWRLHTEFNVPNVVISSIPITQARLSWIPEQFRLRNALEETPGVIYSEDALICICSSYQGTTSTVYATTVPQIRGYFAGVGDLFSALILGHFQPAKLGEEEDKTPLSIATSHALRTIHAILIKTSRAASLAFDSPKDIYTDDELDAKDPERRPRRMKARELRIVGSTNLILSCGKDAAHPIEDLVAWVDFWKDFKK